jgi:hypothetical protein
VTEWLAQVQKTAATLVADNLYLVLVMVVMVVVADIRYLVMVLMLVADKH